MTERLNLAAEEAGNTRTEATGDIQDHCDAPITVLDPATEDILDDIWEDMMESANILLIRRMEEIMDEAISEGIEKARRALPRDQAMAFVYATLSLRGDASLSIADEFRTLISDHRYEMSREMAAKLSEWRSRNQS